MIQIIDEVFFSEKGKRDNNEDNGGWNNGLVYVVCDGVGGHDKGEVASEIVVKTFLKFNTKDTVLPLSQTLGIAEGRMSEYVKENPESIGMGTTLTVVQIKEDGISAGWVGDSRIYQFRDDHIVFQSTDHSWVNEALVAGIITEQEAVGHTKSNIITRAIQGEHNPTQVQEIQLTDIQKNDVFLLCSDGVLETWSNEDFTALFRSETDLNSAAEKIKNECVATSKDNYTGILFKIKSAELKTMVAEPVIEDLESEEYAEDKIESHKVNKVSQEHHCVNNDNYQQRSNHNNKKIILISLAFVLLCAMAFIFMKGSDKKEAGDKELVAEKEMKNDSKKDDRYSTTPVQQNNVTTILKAKIDSLKNGETIFIDDTVIGDNKEHNLYITGLCYSIDSSWMYFYEKDNKWRQVRKDGALLDKKFPGVKEYFESQKNNTSSTESQNDKPSDNPEDPN
jgi:protein phosphatase